MPQTSHSLLFDLLADLRKPEFRDMQQWLLGRSPRLSETWRSVGAFLYPKIRYPQLPRYFPGPEEVYETCMPSIKYTPGHWRRWQHGYLAEIETFLLERSRQERPDQLRYELVELYRRRGLNRHFTIRLSQARRKAEQDLVGDAERLLNDFYLERAAYRVSLKSDRQQDFDPGKQAAALRQSLLALELRHVCQQLAQARLQAGRSKHLEDQAMRLLKEAAAMGYYQQPAIELYARAATLYLSTDQATGDSAFDRFQKTLSHSLHRFSAEEQRDLLLIAINHALRQANAGRLEFLAQLFSLYRRGLEEEILLERGRLSIFTFMNALGAAVNTGQVDWAENFLLEQKFRLPPDRGKEVIALATARLAFIRGDYDQVLKELQGADYRDFIHHMNARLMQLKVYIQLDYYHLANSHISSTKQLLRRKREKSYHLQNYRNIFTLAAKLLRIPPRDEVYAERLRQQIITTKPCTEKEWLLDQLL